MCSKNGVFRYFWCYVQGARNFFGFFLKCHHLALLFPFKMSYWTVTSDFLSQGYGHIKFRHLSEQPWAFTLTLWCIPFWFENLSWKFVLSGFDGLWIRIYSQKIDISISKMADSKWRIEIYEIKRFRSLKNLTRVFQSCWLRKWGRKIDISISKMVDSMPRSKSTENTVLVSQILHSGVLRSSSISCKKKEFFAQSDEFKTKNEN